MNIGFIGTGWVASGHADALKKIPDARITAVTSADMGQSRELAARVGAKAYENYRDMLAKEKLHAVYIMLPPHVHGEIETACSEHVPAIFIEKPITNSIETAQKIEKVFKKARSLVCVGYMSRYRRSVERARELFSEPKNKPVLVNGKWIGDIPGPKWWRNMTQSGGQFVEQCTHVVDTARYIVGEIAEVTAFSTRGFVTDVADYTVDDAMTVNVRFISGAIGNFTTACHLRSGMEVHQGVDLIISSRETQYSQGSGNQSAIFDKRHGHTESFKLENDIFQVEDAAFLRAVAEKKPSLIKSSYADAMKTLAVTLAANESAAAKGKVVFLKD
jgi:myo-inositol 2-dehydrogenase / D-chiro-inositol 1-dehydrogenase